MLITLEKGLERKELRTGMANYLLFGLIPWVGQIIVLILAVMRKQFKAFYFNGAIIALVGIPSVMIAMVLIFWLFPFYISSILLLILMLGLLFFAIYLYVYFVLNMNYLSLKQYLADGYEIVGENKDYDEVKLFVQRANDKKKPWFFKVKF